jgi:hypothetical protein
MARPLIHVPPRMQKRYTELCINNYIKILFIDLCAYFPPPYSWHVRHYALRHVYGLTISNRQSSSLRRRFRNIRCMEANLRDLKNTWKAKSSGPRVSQSLTAVCHKAATPSVAHSWRFNATITSIHAAAHVGVREQLRTDTCSSVSTCEHWNCGYAVRT